MHFEDDEDTQSVVVTALESVIVVDKDLLDGVLENQTYCFEELKLGNTVDYHEVLQYPLSKIL